MSAPGILHIDGPEEVQQLVTQLRAIKSPDLAIFEAVATGDMTLVSFLERIAEWPADMMAGCKRPTIINLYDGDPASDISSVGPSGWGSVSGLARWAKAALILVGPGTPKHYEQALSWALVARRLVIVHSAEEHAQSWHYALGCRDTLMVAPATGLRAVRPRVLH